MVTFHTMTYLGRMYDRCMADTVKHVSVRFPGPIHQAIETSAREDRRSINAQILILIEEALAARSKHHA